MKSLELRNIPDETALMDLLRRDLLTAEKPHITFFAGHFPLVYKHSDNPPRHATNKGTYAETDLHRWGAFTLHTLDMATLIGESCGRRGKSVEFVFFADDHTYADNSRQTRTARKNFYRAHSGEQARLPDVMRSYFTQRGLDESHVMRADHGSKDRSDCLFHSELILRASNKNIENACAREYVEWIENSLNKERDYLVSFIPGRCEQNICSYALDNYVKGLSASHVFMATDSLLDLAGSGIDPVRPPSTVRELYEMGVTYRKDRGE